MSSVETKVEAATTVIEAQPLTRHPPRTNDDDSDDCISEMEKCSLKDNESCHCLWQMMRAVHGIFHWMNTLTCIRRHRKCKRGEADSEDDGGVEKELSNLEKNTIKEEEEEEVEDGTTEKMKDVEMMK
jgi:hypothetical protein